MAHRKTKLTISSVAEIAGVSVATVSRVMNNPDSVRQEKREKVLQVMERLNYKPSTLARGLSVASLGLIGITVPNITNQANAQIVYSAMDYLEKQGYGVLLFDSREDLRREEQIYTNLPQELIDGVIVIYGNGSPETYEELGKHIPVILTGPPMQKVAVDQVCVDELSGFRTLLSYFCEAGHTDVGCLYGSDETKGGARRKALFLKAMEEVGLPVNPAWLKPCDWTLKGGYRSSALLLESGKLPSALIGSSDQIAIGAARFFHDKDVKIPGDISIAGFDNSPMSQYVTPSLTTLELPHSELGIVSAEQLIKRIRNPEREIAAFNVPLRMIERESTGET